MYWIFPRLTVCDIYGVPRGKLVPSRSAEAALERGMGTFIGNYNYTNLVPLALDPVVLISRGSYGEGDGHLHR